MTRRLGPVVLALLAVSGCGGHADSSAGISGPASEISGRLEGVGGPAGNPPTPWLGTVTLTPVGGDGNQVRTVHTDARGHFDLAAVSVGSYTLTGHSPEYGNGHYLCHGTSTVEVHAHQAAHLNVVCQLK
jgi:hypothetical protein